MHNMHTDKERMKANIGITITKEVILHTPSSKSKKDKHFMHN